MIKCNCINIWYFSTRKWKELQSALSRIWIGYLPPLQHQNSINLTVWTTHSNGVNEIKKQNSSSLVYSTYNIFELFIEEPPFLRFEIKKKIIRKKLSLAVFEPASPCSNTTTLYLLPNSQPFPKLITDLAYKSLFNH